MDNNYNRVTKYRSVPKDKQKQIDNSVISQAVYLWLTNELGYRSGRSSSIVDDTIFDKETTKEEVQKICKNEFIPIFKFLMERVKPIKEVARIRNGTINQQLDVTLHHIKRSKARSSSSASTVRDDNFLHKAKIDKKLTRINTSTENGERQINELILHIAEIEFQIRKVQEEIREKKSKIYMKKEFQENCKSFAAIEDKYRYHLEEYKGKTGIKDEIITSQKGSETTMTIKIKKICEKLKFLGKNMLSKNLICESEKNQVRSLMEGLLKNSPPKLILKSVSGVIKSASRDLTSCSELPVDNTINETINKVQRLLQQRRESHIEKFIETEAILNNIFKLRENIKQETESINAYIKKKYVHIPSMDDSIIQMLNSKASLEANQAVLNRIMRFVNFLESQQQNLVAYSDELPILFNRVNDYNNVIEEKQTNIQRLIKINLLTRMNFIKQSKEISSFVQEELFTFANIIENLGKNLDSMIIKENEKFKNLNLGLAKQVKLQSGFRIISTLDINRTLDDKFVRDIKDLIHCPKYLSADRIFLVLSDLKREGVVFEIARSYLNKNIKPCHYDFQTLAIRWLSAIGAGVVTNFDKNGAFLQTTDGMQQAVKALKDLLEKQEQSFLSKEILRLNREIDIINKAENIFREIQDILEEREKILNGQIGSQIIAQGRK
ncbi:HAUS augmin-like complex subunit 5 [Rhizophagus clarus]|uniref:HAUS augmin-like complex subunit 5 n=2 Tax=Rhizophagus clarus TaxID=94130 RepID=A0A8H3QDJ2_9GLOM|nr:HAUS augmin-like complex subunit 5 [Rhizophagus clarus]